MMEILDIYNENKEKTEKKYIRGTNNLKNNEYVVVVEIAVLNKNKELLLSKRSEFKKNNPLKWETTQGSVKSGENSFEAAKRELNEELGINIYIEDLNLFETIKDESEHTFKDLFWVNMNVDIKEIDFKDGEVVDAKWVDKEVFIKMFEDDLLCNNMDFNVDKLDSIKI